MLAGLAAGTEATDYEEDPSIQLRPGYQADQLFLARMQCVDAAEQFAAAGDSLVSKLQSLESEWEHSLQAEFCLTRGGWEVQLLIGLMAALYVAMLGLVIAISCRARRPLLVPAVPPASRAADLRRSDESYPMTLRCRRPRALELPKLQVPAGGTAV